MNNLPEKIVSAQDLKLCEVCARTFTPDRISAHEQICRMSSENSRSSFDTSQQRIRSIEAENFAITGVQERVPNKVHENRPTGLYTNWRLQHEDFIKAIRNAKSMMEKKSPSKPNDLSAALSIEINNYVHCPYCLKEFNQPSAERHVKMCASMRCRTPKSKTRLTESRDQKTSKTSIANK